MSFHVPEKNRVHVDDNGIPIPVDATGTNNGAFVFHLKIGRKDPLRFFVIASSGMGWEHVSVSTRIRVPTWAEMCFLKGVFWDPEDCVIQFHPPASEYVNYHPGCLHLWRPTDQEIPRPHPLMVGPVTGQTRAPSPR